MTVRSLDLLDLPSLPRYRRDVLSLDSARTLTRGNPLGAVALLAYLNPRRHIYTAVCTGDGLTLMGQVVQSAGEPFARLTFLAPNELLGAGEAPLLEHLSGQAGGWGALHLLAEVDERSKAFKSLRQVGFAMYAWQRVWKLATLSKEVEAGWQETDSSDIPAIQSLYSQIVPALIQPVEVLPRKPDGLVCRTNGEVQAYVGLTYGPAGIWVQPLIHPDAEAVPERITALFHNLPDRRERPVYVCVRSYQAWLEGVLEDLGADAGPRQAVMVKRLVKLQKIGEKIPAMEKALKPAAPIASSTKMLYSSSSESYYGRAVTYHYSGKEKK
jgi:hypothetical protein